MTLRKPYLYEPRLQRLSLYHRALAYPARPRILEILHEQGEISFSEIVDAMPLCEAAVSDHLKILRETGLLKTRMMGRFHFYSIDETGIADGQLVMSDFTDTLLIGC